MAQFLILLAKVTQSNKDIFLDYFIAYAFTLTKNY